MAATPEQIVDILQDMGDPDGLTWSEAEVHRYWDRCAGAQSDTQRHEAVMALMFRSLLSNATKLRDYTAGETEEKLSQVYAQLEKQYKMYLPSLNAAQSQNVAIAKARVKVAPRQGRNYPAGYVHEADDDAQL